MNIYRVCKMLLDQYHIHPRRWLSAFLSYPRYLGYIRPYLSAATEEEYIIRRKVLKSCWTPRQLTVPCGKKILVLSPHADDESIGAGGLLWAHKDIAEIHCILVSRGEKGGALEQCVADQQHYSAQLASTRRAEFSKTAQMLNAQSIHFLDFPDGDIPCTVDNAQRLRALIISISPDLVVLPWFFDDWPDHRRTNVLYAWACADLEAMVLAYEVWTLLEPNAVLDITPYIEGKKMIIENYKSQLRTVDYVRYITALSHIRAFQHSHHPRRKGAFEAFLALPNREYCELVQHFYGGPGVLKEAARKDLG